MKTTHFFLLAAFIAALSLLLLSSCGTVGDGGNNNSNNPQQEVEPSSSSVEQQQPPPPPLPSSSSVAPPPPQPSSSSRPPSSSSRPSSSSSLPAPSSSSVVEKPSKMLIKLIHYEEHEPLDAFGNHGDPKITVNVKSYSGGVVVKDVTTMVLLDKEDIASWTGSEIDIVEIYPMAERIVVQPIIVDKDIGFDDDVSPSSKTISESDIKVGATFDNVIFSGTKASCTLSITLYNLNWSSL